LQEGATSADNELSAVVDWISRYLTIIPGEPMALEHEIQVYRLHLIDMLGVNDINEGKFTVIKGDDIQGPFDSYEEALQFGYNKHGLVPFLVKKIERNESVLYFSRPL
jgi:hypothetical protein